jgi:regulator of replication initiation timing
MEDLLREAFQLGQQWVQDMSNEKQPTDFNSWYSSDKTQERVKNCSIPAIVGRSGQLVCDSYYANNLSMQKECLNCGKLSTEH